MHDGSIWELGVLGHCGFQLMQHVSEMLYYVGKKGDKKVYIITFGRMNQIKYAQINFLFGSTACSESKANVKPMEGFLCSTGAAIKHGTRRFGGEILYWILFHFNLLTCLKITSQPRVFIKTNYTECCVGLIHFVKRKTSGYHTRQVQTLPKKAQ